MAREVHKNTLLLGATAIVCAAALYQGLTLRRVTLPTDKLPRGSCLRIVLLSDLHGTLYGRQQQQLVAVVASQKPHLILLTGDIFDEVHPHTAAQQLLWGIRNIAPAYCVAGNHEYFCRGVDSVLQKLQKHGATLLSDGYKKCVIGGVPLVIAGAEDPARNIFYDRAYTPEAAMAKAFSDLGEQPGYRILLSHRPDRIDLYRQYPFDLVVSGHAHGGQLRIPFLLNGLVAPNQGLFPPYAGGLYRHGDLCHVVSRGLSRIPLLPRVFNPPEVVAITVRSNAAANRR